MNNKNISNSLFVRNRKNFSEKLSKNSMAVFCANEEMPRNGDQFYPSISPASTATAHTLYYTRTIRILPCARFSSWSLIAKAKWFGAAKWLTPRKLPISQEWQMWCIATTSMLCFKTSPSHAIQFISTLTNILVMNVRS